MEKRLPAEWELQDGVIVTWPSERTDWRCCLKDVEESYIEIVRIISEYEKVIIITDRPERAKYLLSFSKINLHNLFFIEENYNDTWVRDYGPIVLVNEEGYEILNFTFDGWGSKFNSVLDNLVTEKLYQKGLFKNSFLRNIDFTLEGGSIDTNGKGVLITTEKCLISSGRNPSLSQENIEDKLKSYLCVKDVIFLKHGELIGDDTDAHIDTIARFVSEDTILCVAPPEDRYDPHYLEFKLLEEEISILNGRFNVEFLPFAPAVFYRGERLPATYANFLITNEKILLPAYGDEKKDFMAKEIVEHFFPKRKVVFVNSLVLIRQHGAIHCSTMQLPAGVLNCELFAS